MKLEFPGDLSARRIACFKDRQYFHNPEKMRVFRRRPIIQGLDIMTQMLGRLTEVIGVGFSVQFCNPIAGGDSVVAEITSEGFLKAEGPAGDILSREEQAMLLTDPVVIEDRPHYPYKFKLDDSLGEYRNLLGFEIEEDKLRYLLAIGAHSGALVHRFSRFDDPVYEGVNDGDVNGYFHEMRERNFYPLFLDIRVATSGESVEEGAVLEFGTLFDSEVGRKRYGKVTVFCRSAGKSIFRTDVQFMMLSTEVINRRYSKPLEVA
ncbi:MAG: hypothetical protein ACFCU4_10220 [Puniceicoccaceae bacterium]